MLPQQPGYQNTLSPQPSTSGTQNSAACRLHPAGLTSARATACKGSPEGPKPCSAPRPAPSSDPVPAPGRPPRPVPRGGAGSGPGITRLLPAAQITHRILTALSAEDTKTVSPFLPYLPPTGVAEGRGTTATLARGTAPPPPPRPRGQAGRRCPAPCGGRGGEGGPWPRTHQVQSLAPSNASSRRGGAAAPGGGSDPGAAAAAAAAAPGGGAPASAASMPRPCARRDGGRDGESELRRRRVAPAGGRSGAAGRENRAPLAADGTGRAEPSFVPAEGPPPGGAQLVLGRGGGGTTAELSRLPWDASRIPSA